MKKLFLASLFMMIAGSFALADTQADVMKTFDNYIQAANGYSTAIPSYYTKDAKIVRVVNKKQGGQKSVIIPFDRYLQELDKNAKYAKLVSYKNRYENRKITKIDENNYKISSTRIPRNDKTGLPCYFVFTKTSSGWKIKEESMTTNVQTFLNAK